MNYGARHLKRAIERRLVQPMSNLIATQQVGGGDWVQVDFDPEAGRMTFLKRAQGMPPYAMAELVNEPAAPEVVAAAGASALELIRATRAGSSRRG